MHPSGASLCRCHPLHAHTRTHACTPPALGRTCAPGRGLRDGDSLPTHTMHIHMHTNTCTPLAPGRTPAPPGGAFADVCGHPRPLARHQRCGGVAEPGLRGRCGGGGVIWWSCGGAEGGRGKGVGLGTATRARLTLAPAHVTHSAHCAPATHPATQHGARMIPPSPQAQCMWVG